MFEDEVNRPNAEVRQWRERAQKILDHARRVADEAQQRESRCIDPDGEGVPHMTEVSRADGVPTDARGGEGSRDQEDDRGREERVEPGDSEDRGESRSLEV